ncbi:MAG: hypothetical protein QOH21_3553, partial [Acidobacteriota bacterium]|nr:hypothetical protein [Acidobacteriota bacterium]
MRARAASIVLALAVSLAARGDEAPLRRVHVTLAAPAGTAESSGTVTLRPVMGPQAPLSQPVTDRAEPLTFAVPARTMWTITVALPGWWAAPVVVEVRDADLNVTVPLVRTGSVTGHLVTPTGSRRPEGLSVVVDVPPGARTLPGPPSAETPCVLAEDATFSCELPAGTLDLVFRPRGYVPAYRWGVAVTAAARKDLGAFALSQGAALSGFVTSRGKALQPGQGKVELFLEVAGSGTTAHRLRRPVASAVLAKNGFFQLTDVPPGRYVLQASHPGLAEAVVSPLQVYAEVETKLRRPIELQPPSTLTLRVSPATAPEGGPWLFRVQRASPVTNRYEAAPVFEGAAGEGTVVLREQPGGRYRVTVADAAGNPFASEEFTTSGGGDETHEFAVELVKVQGKLHRGDNPLAA